MRHDSSRKVRPSAPGDATRVTLALAPSTRTSPSSSHQSMRRFDVRSHSGVSESACLISGIGGIC
uniref:Uncharacterized protein n=1 Tax=Arundo donax TaxID=35708 RepID=A0A0A9EZL9_ARUDO